MGANRSRRIETVKNGYSEKKRSVRVARHSEALEKVVARRVDRGYRKGRVVVNKGKEMELVLAFTHKGGAVRQERQVIGTATRPLQVDHKQRWGRTGPGGTYRRETTEGRRTAEEATKKGLGGKRRLWVN
jgi:hypothetical protein